MSEYSFNILAFESTPLSELFYISKEKMTFFLGYIILTKNVRDLLLADAMTWKW